MILKDIRIGQKFEFTSGAYSGVAAELISVQKEHTMIDPLDCDNRSLGLGKMPIYPEDGDEVKLVDNIS